jgi:hypothetical protein
MISSFEAETHVFFSFGNEEGTDLITMASKG